jgi:type I restriction enzyme R subunit
MGQGHTDESEWRTRKRLIDPKLRAASWRVAKYDPAHPFGKSGALAIEEFPTDNGPADYALCVEGQLLGVVEAKRLTLGPQNALTQAERYSRGATQSPLNYQGFRVPFLYSTNGEVLWHHDVRHPQSRSRRIAHFHTPDALREQLGRDGEAAGERLAQTPNDHPKLRPYQTEANAAIERAIADRKRHMLIAMATGTGKTFTLVNEIYRLMKAGVAKRVLFLVDRRALAAQAVREFASFEAEPGRKFTAIYEVYSQRFQRGDIEDEPFNPNVLPASYLTAPQPGHAFVYVSTIQRMTINLFGRAAVFGDGEEEEDPETDKLDIPIHAFDLVIADECHRGYTSAEVAVWRNTLDHFDAIKIGLTATPAAHTTSYFKDVVFRYEYERAVRDGYLVDYDAVAIKSDVRIHGVFLGEGEQVGMVNQETGKEQLDLLEAEREFDATEIEQRVTAPDSNRKILEEVRTYALAHEAEHGRFPKTLIFGVHDLPHTSHADQLVDIARDVFGQGDSFVQKITGRADRPLQRIREFRNRKLPAVVVTVDMLSTGVDIPDLEFIVLLRPVKSRILFEQILGRGTRKGEHVPDKAKFTVFDCFAGTLLEYFRKVTGITAETPAPPSRTIPEIVEDIWQNRDRDYNTHCLVKRFHRTAKAMSGDARDYFAKFIPNGDLAAFAAELPQRLAKDFTGTMTILRDQEFQHLLEDYPRTRQPFLIAYETQDAVTSTQLVKGPDGTEYKPEDYLAAFARFVQENTSQIAAIRILLDRPREWSPQALIDLRKRLLEAPRRFTVPNLQRAHELHYRKALVDIISMVKHAAKQDEPLFTAEERVQRAFMRVTAGRAFTAEQQDWLERIRVHMVESLSIEEEDFETIPVFSRAGGWGKANQTFDNRLPDLLRGINEAIAA